MIKALRFIEDYRVWKVDDTIDFPERVTVLVGDQGTGKSTLLSAISLLTKKKKFERKKYVSLECSPMSVRYMDFEKDNPRIKSYFDYDKDIQFQVSCRFASHGEINRVFFNYLDKSGSDVVYLMDEPDTALSIRSIEEMIGKIQNTAAQVILSTHNIRIMTAFGQVYSCEHRKYMPAYEFIQEQLTTPRTIFFKTANKKKENIHTVSTKTKPKNLMGKQPKKEIVYDK